MLNSMKLVSNGDGTYDVVVFYNKFDTEFAKDFFTKETMSNGYKAVGDFLKRNGKNIRVNAVRIVAAGLVIALIPVNAFMSVFAAGTPRYSMAYLYGGTVAQQIDYVERTNNSLQTVSPSYFDIIADGSLKLNPVSKDFVERMHASNIKVVPFLSNHWDRNAGIIALQDVEKLSTQIADYVELYNLDGVNVDIENVTDKQKDQYTELVRLLRQKITAEKEVSVAVAANPNNWQVGWHGSYDYAALGDTSDYLMLMTYDEHYEGGPAGPVASIGFVEKSIQHALSNTSADKVVVGLPMFGRIWSQHDTSFVGKGVPIKTVNSMVQDYNAKVTYDEATQSPKAEFEVKEGDKLHTISGKTLQPGKYVIWFENDQSLEAKLKLVQKYDLKGAGSWALGQEDASIWENYNTWLNGDIPEEVPPEESQYFDYTVKAGDTLWQLSQQVGCTVDEIKAINNLASDALKVGDALKLPAPMVEADGWITTNTPTTNVMAQTNLTSNVLAVLDGGTQLTTIGKPINNAFYQVRLENGTVGYVETMHITSEKPEVPVPPTPSEPPAPEPPAEEEEVATKVTTAKVNVRATASTSGKSLGNINKGTTVVVLGTSGSFTQIDYNGIVGYVETKNLA